MLPAQRTNKMHSIKSIRLTTRATIRFLRVEPIGSKENVLCAIAHSVLLVDVTHLPRRLSRRRNPVNSI